jgi:porphobilinogen synthase
VLTSSDFIYPMFVRYGKGIKEEIPSMPGCYRYSVDELMVEVKSLVSTGVSSFILFGIPEQKDELAKGAYDKNGIVQVAVREIKGAVPEAFVITDVCLCEYTSHGHCGVVHNGKIMNDPSLELLAKTALSHAEAGADMVAPSDMMDGRVSAIRDALDGNGYYDVPIMSYSVKYASAFYGPFRDAAGSTPQFGNRHTYQMDYANRQEAIREAAMDIEEGADIVMVKPALAYLDVISDIKQAFSVPVAAYHVSGEYAMVKAAAQQGWLDETMAMLEILTSIKRAGADLILTYFAPAVLKELN